MRELKEETDVVCEALSPQHVLEQEVQFYANFDDEFWDYSQTYWRIDALQAEALYFDGERQPEDALKAAWVPLDEVESLSMHAVHSEILREMI